VIVPYAALALCFALRPGGRDLGLVAIAAMMGVAGYLAVRNMALAVIASTTPLSGMPPSRLRIRASAIRRRPRRERARAKR